MRYVKQKAFCDQEELKTKSVLVVGAGALACAAIPYLLGAGVGKVAALDGDVVELTNLHRQVLYDETQIGLPKVDAMQKLNTLNSTVEFLPIRDFLAPSNAERLIGPYDLILDATDRFSAKRLIDEMCFALNKPWVYASIEGWIGQVALFHKARFSELFPGLHDEMSLSCSEGGVLGPLAGMLGSIQALEALKWLGGNSTPNQLIQINALTWKVRMFSFGENVNVKQVEEGDLVIDVRRPEEYAKPAGELAIPYPEILEADLPKDRKIILVCKSGARSLAAAKHLRKRGFAAYSLEGGVNR